MCSAFLWRSAPSKLEIADACTPVEASRGGVVFVCVVECAVVRRIDSDIGVIAPAIRGAALAPGAIEKMLFP